MRIAVVQILFNLKSKTWHPIWFMENPIKEAYYDKKIPLRFSTEEYHLEGFSKRSDAVREAHQMAVELKALWIIKEVFLDNIDKDYIWDGQDIPKYNIYRFRESLSIKGTIKIKLLYIFGMFLLLLGFTLEFADVLIFTATFWFCFAIGMFCVLEVLSREMRERRQ